MGWLVGWLAGLFIVERWKCGRVERWKGVAWIGSHKEVCPERRESPKASASGLHKGAQRERD